MCVNVQQWCCGCADLKTGILIMAAIDVVLMVILEVVLSVVMFHSFANVSLCLWFGLVGEALLIIGMLTNTEFLIILWQIENIIATVVMFLMWPVLPAIYFALYFAEVVTDACEDF